MCFNVIQQYKSVSVLKRNVKITNIFCLISIRFYDSNFFLLFNNSVQFSLSQDNEFHVCITYQACSCFGIYFSSDVFHFRVDVVQNSILIAQESKLFFLFQSLNHDFRDGFAGYFLLLVGFFCQRFFSE